MNKNSHTILMKRVFSHMFENIGYSTIYIYMVQIHLPALTPPDGDEDTIFVGLFEEDLVGLKVGDEVGLKDGEKDGDLVAMKVGPLDGLEVVGLLEGN
mmetsp:Transcript_25187/g.34637  ORF Transcript_25187/g.34637 Transcript_25187/m.34637 type:complete len:98 (+) Transcript_25187:241-534(+)